MLSDVTTTLFNPVSVNAFCPIIILSDSMVNFSVNPENELLPIDITVDGMTREPIKLMQP